MPSIWGQSSTKGNTDQPCKRHCRCRRRARPREDTPRGSFFFFSSETRRSDRPRVPKAWRTVPAWRHSEQLLVQLRLLHHLHVPPLLVLLFLLQRQGLHEEEPEGATIADFSRRISPGEEFPMRSATGCGRSSAARAQRDCAAASPGGGVFCARAGASRTPPPPRCW